jgi:hypothetical protein
MPFDSSYTPPQAPAGMITMQQAEERAQTLRNAVEQAQLTRQQLAEGQQRMAANELDLRTKQQQLEETKAINDAYRSSLSVAPDGTASIDSTKLTRGLAAAGHGKAIPSILEGVTKYQKANADLAEAQGKVKVQEADAAGALGAALAASNDDPHLFTTLAQHEINAKTVDAGVIAPMVQRVQQAMVDDPTGAQAKALVSQFRTQLQAASAEQQKQLAANKTANASQQNADRETAQFNLTKGGLEADAIQKQAAGLAPQLEAAFKKGGPDAVNAILDQTPRIVANRFNGASKSGDFLAAALTPEQATQANRENANATETRRHNLETEAEARKRTGIEQQNASINAKKFAMEFGGDAVKGWVKQVADNPDTAGQVPPALRTPVAQAYTASTGLPFPKPLTGQAVDQERAAHNALKAVAQITEALQDPEIQARRGPVLGRIGNVEQDAGATVGLSPSAAAKAAELRSNLRYLFTQELKANIGGRPPVELAKALEAVSPNIKLDDALMQGSLAGVKDAALRTLDATDEQRFGSGKGRTREARGLAPAAAPSTSIDPSQNPFRKK